jgi:uncharacterized protein YecT (DUF1311 family)
MKYLAIFLLSSVAFAQDNSKTYSTCMDMSGGVTANMVECTQNELVVWDKKLNAAYSSTMKTLSPFQKKKLVDAQRLWILFRDASCAFYTNPEGGTLQQVQYIDCLLTATKTRAIDVEALRNDL